MPVGTGSVFHRSSPLNTSAYCVRNISDVTERQHRLLNLALGRPQLAEKDRRAGLVRPDRLGRQIDRHAPGERVRDDERRRREIVRAHLLLDAPLEVAVAAQHRGDDEIARFDFGADLVGQRTAVADAGRAAVADEVEAELIEVLLEARLAADTR